jgi:hypothetical protein
LRVVKGRRETALFFVPFCAIFVPWNFSSGLIRIREFRVSDWH